MKEILKTDLKTLAGDARQMHAHLNEAVDRQLALGDELLKNDPREFHMRFIRISIAIVIVFFVSLAVFVIVHR